MGLKSTRRQWSGIVVLSNECSGSSGSTNSVHVVDLASGTGVKTGRLTRDRPKLIRWPFIAFAGYIHNVR